MRTKEVPVGQNSLVVNQISGMVCSNESHTCNGLFPIDQFNLIHLKGVSHGDELLYLYPMREQSFQDSLPTEQDEQLRVVMVEMWTNFIITGYDHRRHTMINRNMIKNLNIIEHLQF